MNSIPKDRSIYETRTDAYPPAPACRGHQAAKIGFASHCSQVLAPAAFCYPILRCQFASLLSCLLAVWGSAIWCLVTGNRTRGGTFNLPLTVLPQPWAVQSASLATPLPQQIIQEPLRVAKLTSSAPKPASNDSNSSS